MVVDKTLVYGPPSQRDRHLLFPPEQRPIVLQLGGSEPDLLRRAGRIAAPYGYDEVNLNCGCPSDRVAGAGCFGAALMLDARRVAECCAALSDGLAEGCAAAAAAALAADGVGGGGGTSAAAPTSIAPPPVSVKCRLGVDDADTYSALREFVRVVSAPPSEGGGGVSHFIIHARKCLLNGLSPAQNRSVPPLRHEWLWALKRDFPELRFTLNGGVASGRHAAAALAAREHGLGRRVPHGVMIGRAAASDPWGCLAGADELVFGDAAAAAGENGRRLTRRQVVDAYCEYADAVLAAARREAAEAAAAGGGGGNPTTEPPPPPPRQQDDGEEEEEEEEQAAGAGDHHHNANHNNSTSQARVYVPSVRHLARPLVGMLHGAQGGRRYRAALDEAMRDRAAHLTVRSLMDAALSVVPPEELDREAPSYASAGARGRALEEGRREAEAAEEAGEEGAAEEGGLPLWWEWTAAEDDQAADDVQEDQAEAEDAPGAPAAAAAARDQQQQQQQQQQEEQQQPPLPPPPPKPQPLLPSYRLGPLPGPSDRAAGEFEASDLQAKDARRAARRHQRRQERDSRKRVAKEAAVGGASGGGGRVAAAVAAAIDRPAS
jgi:tRNA-dihydrouridine synthase